MFIKDFIPSKIFFLIPYSLFDQLRYLLVITISPFAAYNNSAWFQHYLI